MPKLYSYVVQHDTGYAPNPYFGLCTLCGCKYRKNSAKPKNIVELAVEKDWIVGTGGADEHKSGGHGKVVYAMRVDEKLTRGEYFADPRFAKKKPRSTGTYAQKKGDNHQPRRDFERKKQFALISRHFYYFGAGAIDIPRNFLNRGLEKKGPGFRSDFPDVRGFIEWIEAQGKPGKHGEPRTKPADESKRSEKCKSSC